MGMRLFFGLIGFAGTGLFPLFLSIFFKVLTKKIFETDLKLYCKGCFLEMFLLFLEKTAFYIPRKKSSIANHRNPVFR